MEKYGRRRRNKREQGVRMRGVGHHGTQLPRQPQRKSESEIFMSKKREKPRDKREMAYFKLGKTGQK